jgi:hypothetical protein
MLDLVERDHVAAQLEEWVTRLGQQTGLTNTGLR